MVLFLKFETEIWKVNMTHEEFRHYVYNQYDTMNGVYKNSPERCYELINDRQKPQPTRSRYSQYEHHYKIKW